MGGVELHDLLSEVRAGVIFIKRSIGSIDLLDLLVELFLLELGDLPSPLVLLLAVAQVVALSQDVPASLLQC
jgi:hypothetical protein